MARNRVQFQKGYSLTQFMDEYGTKEKCREALFRWRLAERVRLSKIASTPDTVAFKVVRCIGAAGAGTRSR